MIFLHAFNDGLQVLDLWRYIFSKFLDGLVDRVEIEDSMCFTGKDWDASKFRYQLFLEIDPIGDVVELRSFSKGWHMSSVEF